MYFYTFRPKKVSFIRHYESKGFELPKQHRTTSRASLIFVQISLTPLIVALKRVTLMAYAKNDK